MYPSHASGPTEDLHHLPRYESGYPTTNAAENFPPTSSAVHRRFLENLSTFVPSSRAAHLIGAYLSGDASIVLDNPTVDGAVSSSSSSSSPALSTPASSLPSSFDSAPDSAPVAGADGFARFVNGRGDMSGSVEGHPGGGPGTGDRAAPSAVRSEEDVRRARQDYASQQRKQIQFQFMANYRQSLPPHQQQHAPPPPQQLWQQSQPLHSFLPSQTPSQTAPPPPRFASQYHSNHPDRLSYANYQNSGGFSHLPPTPSQPSQQYSFLGQPPQSYGNHQNPIINDPSFHSFYQANRFEHPSSSTSGFPPFNAPSYTYPSGAGAWQSQPHTALGGDRTLRGSQDGASSLFGYGQQQQQGQLGSGPGMISGGSPVDSSHMHQSLSHPPHHASHLFSTSHDDPVNASPQSPDRRGSSPERRVSSDGSYVDDTIRSSNKRTTKPRGRTNEDSKNKHVCLICNKGFARAYNLKAHHATHDPVRIKPHKCPHLTCSRAFSRSHDLDRHRMGIHGDGPLSTKGASIPSNYACKSNGGRPNRPPTSKAKKRAVRGISQTPLQPTAAFPSPSVSSSSRRSSTRAQKQNSYLDEDEELACGEEAASEHDEDGDYVA